MERADEEQLYCAGTTLIGDKAHCDGGDKKEVNPRRNVEQWGQSGVSPVYDIEIGGDDPEQQPREEKEDAYDEVTCRRAEESGNLFFV